MKILLLALALFATPLASHAALQGAPYQPEVDNRFHLLEKDGSEGETIAKKYVEATYDVAVDGGGSTSHDLGVDLPAGAIITAMYVYINTAFTKFGGGTGVASVALQCSGTRDLMSYQNISAYAATSYWAQIMAGFTGYTGGVLIPQRAATSDNVASVPTACNVTAVVRGDSGYEPYSAGKFTAIIEYFKR